MSWIESMNWKFFSKNDLSPWYEHMALSELTINTDTAIYVYITWNCTDSVNTKVIAMGH